MTIYDAAMAILLVLGMVRGAWQGFTWQVASLASLILGYIAAHTVSGQVAPYLPGAPEFQRVLAMVVVYLVVSGGIFAIAWMVRGTLQKLKFVAYDRHLGMLLGGAEAIGVGLVATMFVVSLAPATRQPIFASPTGRVVGTVMNQLGPVLPAEVRKVLAPHWDGDFSTETIADDHAQPASTPAQQSAGNNAQAADPSALPELHGAAGTNHAAEPELTALPPLEPASTHQARDPGLHRANGKSAAAQLESALERGRREIDQAVAETLDVDPNQKAPSVRQLVQKDKQRIKDAVNSTVGKARQQVGQVRGQASKRQQELEQAISNSITKGQEQVEQAITDSIDQQIRRLGGLQPATAPGTGGK
jgi:membrane protein required for colicin V production